MRSVVISIKQEPSVQYGYVFFSSLIQWVCISELSRQGIEFKQNWYLTKNKSDKWREGLSSRGSMDASEQNDGLGIQVEYGGKWRQWVRKKDMREMVGSVTDPEGV